MKRDIKYNEYAGEFMEQLPKGVFLTARAGDKLNVMTIGWGVLGYIWKKPTLVVAVRYSRHTYSILDKAGEFTVSIPLNGNLKKELAVCGTKSGRDINKFKECGLTTEPGKVTGTPVIGACNLFYECRVIYRQAMEPALVTAETYKECYPQGDFHVLYYGEIVASYIKE